MQLPVFQMKLGMRPDFGVGWEFSDEGEAQAESFAYTVAWNPMQRWEDVELLLASEQQGEAIDVRLASNGNVFVNEGLGVRFSLHDPMAPNDFRGLPFVRAFPYIGAAAEVLGAYGISHEAVFLPLAPLDLIRMDELFQIQRLVFVGVTKSFGPHLSDSLGVREIAESSSSATKTLRIAGA